VTRRDCATGPHKPSSEKATTLRPGDIADYLTHRKKNEETEEYVPNEITGQSLRKGLNKTEISNLPDKQFACSK